MIFLNELSITGTWWENEKQDFDARDKGLYPESHVVRFRKQKAHWLGSVKDYGFG